MKLNNIIIIVILILLFITSDTVAIPTFFPIDINYARKNNTIENEQTLKALLYLDKIQFETKNVRAYQINKIYNMNHKKNNIEGSIRVPEPNTIILGTIGTLIVVWMRRSRLL